MTFDLNALKERLEQKQYELAEKIVDDYLARGDTLSASEVGNAIRLFKESGIALVVTEAEIPDSLKEALDEGTADPNAPIPFPKQKQA